MTQKEALQRINTAIHNWAFCSDVEVTPDQINGKTHQITINGHEKGWIKSGYRCPVELLVWFEGVYAVWYNTNWMKL